MPRAFARASDLGTMLLLATAAFAGPLDAQDAGRYARIQLSDSISVAIHLGGTDTRVVATTPQGMFLLRADSSALAAWARASASLPGPTLAGPGSERPAFFSASVLKASDQSGNAMRLLRLTGDSASVYSLRVSNGAWESGGRIRPEMAKVLFRALTGSEGEGVEWHPYPPHADSFPPGYKNAEPAPGNPAPRYPARAELARADGDVVAQFTIGKDGRVRPESLLIVRSTHPLFSLAVREALPSMRFLPATQSGVPVQTTVVQEFQFKVP